MSDATASVSTTPTTTHRVSIAKLAEALSKAQGEFPLIPKDSKVEVYSKPPERKLLYTYMYADLTTIITCVRPALAKHGLSFTQDYGLKNAFEGFFTRLMHASGEILDSGFVKCKIDDKDDMKIVAGLVTYAKRISLTAALGISADDDNDAAGIEGKAGNSTVKPAAIKKPAPKTEPAVKGPTQAQLTRLYAIASEAGWPKESVRAYSVRKVKRTPSQLSADQYAKLCAHLHGTPYDDETIFEIDGIIESLTDAEKNILNPEKVK